MTFCYNCCIYGIYDYLCIVIIIKMTFNFMIHKDDKEALRQYVNKVCEEQSVYNIDVFFFLGPHNNELIRFMINGQSIIKDTFFEAVCFIDGIYFCLPYLIAHE